MMMIKDKNKKVLYQKEWNGVRTFQCRTQANLNASGGIFGGGSTHTIRDISHNLILLFAFSVFEDVLKQLEKEKRFTAKRDTLGSRMHDSKKALSWNDFDLVDEARDKRNKIAHDQIIFSRGDCWKYIDAIENELVDWRIIKRQVTFQH